MAITIEHLDGKVAYYHPSRGNGKPVMAFVNYCKAMGMADNEIKELFDEANKSIGGTTDGVLE